jgi:putative SOS response-associated peptidase YedK
MAPIHDRMPVIIARDAYVRWLDPANASAFDLVAPYPTQEMAAYPVSTRVNSPKIDDPGLIERLAQKN